MTQNRAGSSLKASPLNLPMIALDVDKNGDIFAVGVAGLIYDSETIYLTRGGKVNER